MIGSQRRIGRCDDFVFHLKPEVSETKNGWPLGKILDAGFAFCAVYHEDLVKHNEVEFRNSIHRLFYPEGQSFPTAHEWGVLSACAWG